MYEICSAEVTGPSVSLLLRNAASCCLLKARVGAVTRWMATSCARAAALAASRTSLPKSPLTAKQILHFQPLSLYLQRRDFFPLPALDLGLNKWSVAPPAGLFLYFQSQLSIFRFCIYLNLGSLVIFVSDVSSTFVVHSGPASLFLLSINVTEA